MPDRSKIQDLIQEEIKDLKTVGLWRAAFAEFVGTGLLCIFTIGFGLKKEGDEGPSLVAVTVAVGFFIAVIITALMNVSGGHVNPIISWSFFLCGHVTLVRCLVYSVFQCAGAVAGAGFLRALVPEEYVGGLGLLLPAEGIPTSTAVIAEGFTGFFLVFITVAMVDPGRKDVQGSIPMFVGFSVTVNITLAHALSGACFNPARNFAPAVVMGNWDRQWVYWVGPMVGASIASVAYELFFSVLPLKEKRFFKSVQDEDRNGRFGDDELRINDKLIRKSDDESKI